MDLAVLLAVALAVPVVLVVPVIGLAYIFISMAADLFLGGRRRRDHHLLETRQLAARSKGRRARYHRLGF